MRKPTVLLLFALSGVALAQDSTIRYTSPVGLPLAGGTMTGALAGTTAFFTGPVSIGNTSASPYANLYGDAAQTLSLRNSTNAQALFVYNTYTDGSNYERLQITGTGGASFSLTAGTAGTGGDNLNIVLAPAGTGSVNAGTTDTPDLGSSTVLWRSLYLARSVQGSKSKALTDATATSFVRIAIPQTIATNYKGGTVIYEIYCDDDTNQASQSGRVTFTCHNLAGTEACGFGTPDGVTLGDGTASLGTPAFTAATAATDTIDLKVNSDCTGITPNTHTIEYRLDMPTLATLTPQ